MLAWLFPLAFVVGCATPQEEPAEVEFESPIEEEAEAPQPQPTERVRARPGAAGPPKPVPPLALSTIVGLDEARTLELLGEPHSVRVEAPATIWTYNRADGRLDICFFPSVRERRLQSLTDEISGSEDQNRCLSEFGMAGNGSS